MVQWYPGHMAKALREIKEKIGLVDIVIVLLDARIPFSSFNPSLKEIINNKKAFYIFTKKDKADDLQTDKWISYYKSLGILAIAVNSLKQNTIKIVEDACKEVLKEKLESNQKKGLKPRAIRTMIVGIPNVGKSTLINCLVRRKVAVVGDKPGVTKNQQWIKINQNLELLDTPGVLWPKFDDPIVGINLAITKTIKDDILPIVDIANEFISFMQKNYSSRLEARFNIPALDLNLEIIGKELGYLQKGKSEVDLPRTAVYILQEFRDGRFGKITLDRVTDD